MTDKKEWYKNIPENGVLCKFSGVHDEDVIMAVTQQMVEDANAEQTEEDLKKIRPLTAQEWWQFAPWQDMKDAPKNVEILGVCDNELHIVKYATGHWVLSSWIEGDCFLTRNNRKKDITKWLPLPEESQ